MKGLFIKDGYIALKHFISFSIVIVIMLIVGAIIDEGNEWVCVVVSYLTIICSFTACANLLNEDEKSHFNIYSRVLPISRQNIIIEKYVLAIIINIFYLVFAAVAMNIGIGNVTLELIEYMYLNTILTLILSAVIMFLTIRFDSQKAILIVVTIFPIVAVLLMSLFGIYDSHYNTADILWKMKDVFVILSIIIYAMCFYFSSKIYSKKEII